MTASNTIAATQAGTVTSGPSVIRPLLQPSKGVRLKQYEQMQSVELRLICSQWIIVPYEKYSVFWGEEEWHTHSERCPLYDPWFRQRWYRKSNVWLVGSRKLKMYMNVRWQEKSILWRSSVFDWTEQSSARPWWLQDRFVTYSCALRYLNILWSGMRNSNETLWNVKWAREFGDSEINRPDAHVNLKFTAVWTEKES